MTRQRTYGIPPLPMEPLRWARNGRSPTSQLGQQILKGYNHIVGYRRKVLFSKSLHLNNIPAGQAGTVVPWRAYVRTGYAASGAIRLVIECIGAPADNAGAGVPNLLWDVSGGIGSTRPMGLGINTGTIGPTQLTHGIYKLDVAADTAYEINLDLNNYGRIVSAVIYEEHDKAFEDGDTGVSDQTAINAAQAPITDTQHVHLLGNGHNLWKRNGAHCFSWCTDEDPDNGGDAPQRTTNALVNMFDQALATVTADTPGFALACKNHNPYHTKDVPAVLAVYAKNATSAGGSVALVDSDGTLGTVSSFSTAGEWKTVAVNLRGDLSEHKVDLHFAGDGTNELTVYAASVYEYL